jgi:Domain of unknown function (DUF4304)
MPKSEFAQALDRIQTALKPLLTQAGFRVRGRAFNRQTTDGLTQVISIQMGASDPPGTTYIPGLRENMHGMFAVNLGVYVPEVAHYSGSPSKAWIQEYDCCVRARLGELIGEGKEIWWHARSGDDVISDVRHCIEDTAFPFLDRFATRDGILQEWAGRAENMGASRPPRIVSAIILATRGEHDRSRELLVEQVRQATINPGHKKYVAELAARLGLGDLSA